VEILPPKFYDIFVRIHSKRKGKNEDELEPNVQLFFCRDSVRDLACRVHPKIDTMAEAEKVFVKMADKTAAKLELNQDQKSFWRSLS